MTEHLINTNNKLSFNFRLFAILIIAALGIIIYSNSFKCDFQFDDQHVIIDNVQIKDLNNFSDISLWKNINLRTFSSFTFALNYHFNQYNVIGYHLVNLLTHILTGIFSFLLILLMFSSSVLQNEPIAKYKKHIALFCSLIIIAHPLQTQAVTYITQRMTSMASMFYIMSVYFYAKGRFLHINKTKLSAYLLYVLSFISGFLAISSKQIAATLPFAMLMFEMFFIRKENKICKKYLITSFSALVLIILVAVFILKALTRDIETISRTDYLLTQLRAIVKYIQLLFIPVHQNLDYDFSLSKSFLGFEEIGSYFILVMILLSGILLYNTKRLLSFGIFWFFLTLMVESSIIPIRDVIAEQRIYLPMFGFSLVLGCSLWYILSTKRILYFSLILSSLVIVYGILTYQRNKVWETKLSLWFNTVKESPYKARPYNNLGYAYQLNNNLDKALQCYERAIEIDSNFIDALNNIGYIWHLKKDYPKATTYYYKAYTLNPDFVYTLNNIGLVWQDSGNYDSALTFYDKAIKIDSCFVEALFNSGNIWHLKNDIDKAIEFYNRTLAVNPYYEKALYNLGNMWYQKGDYDKAIYFYNKTLNVNPNSVEALNNIGNICYLKGDYDKAISYYNKALNINPNLIESLNNIGNILFVKNDYDNAIGYYEKILSINPQHEKALLYLGNIYSLKKDTNKAIEYYKRLIAINPEYSNTLGKL